MQLLLERDADDEHGDEHERHDGQCSPEALLGLARAMPPLKVGDGLVADEAAEPEAQEAANAVRKERAAKGHDGEVVRRRAESLRRDDGDADNPAECEAVVERGHDDDKVAQLGVSDIWMDDIPWTQGRGRS